MPSYKEWTVVSQIVNDKTEIHLKFDGESAEDYFRSDTETWEMNSYYAVAFEDRWYPGVVTEIKGDDWALIQYAPL